MRGKPFTLLRSIKRIIIIDIYAFIFTDIYDIGNIASRRKRQLGTLPLPPSTVPDVRWINFQSAQCEKVALTGPVRLYTCRPEAHTRALRNTSVGIRARARARARLFVCSHFNGGWRDVDTCTCRGDARYLIAVPLYPANWNFSPRIEFFRENHDARAIYATSWASRCAGALYIHNVIHQNVVMRLIVYRRPSESPGTYFPKRNGNANDLFAPPRYIVIDAGHHRVDVTNVGGCSDH